MISAIGLVHERFSTNTSVSDMARGAHPYRAGIAHNGEFNTLNGSRNWIDSVVRSWIPEHMQHLTPALTPIIDRRWADFLSQFNDAVEALYSSQGIAHRSGGTNPYSGLQRRS